MNSIKKHPAHFSLNLGKLLLHNNGQNPRITYYQLSELFSIPKEDLNSARFQEFVIDACQTTDNTPLVNLLTDLQKYLSEFTVRTLLISSVQQAEIIKPFISHIRLIESINPEVLTDFPIHKTRLACSSWEELQKVQQYRYYIYRNPLPQQMDLPFEFIKCTKTPEYNISYYRDGDFIYSVYKQGE
ncbi:MAG: hypothetical protein ACI351_03090 [Candidatus Avelusimicrobium sp.]|uniref:hypothetical protein n=1 Tax=Candidatus Avelusimicrobium sp. TaxID=3048833 RepID=UPI003F007D5A